MTKEKKSRKDLGDWTRTDLAKGGKDLWRQKDTRRSDGKTRKGSEEKTQHLQDTVHRGRKEEGPNFACLLRLQKVWNVQTFIGVNCLCGPSVKPFHVLQSNICEKGSLKTFGRSNRRSRLLTTTLQVSTRLRTRENIYWTKKKDLL